MKYYSRYLKVISVGCLLAGMLVIGVNRFIDPYDLFGGPKIAGLNKEKPEYYSHLRLGKPMALKFSVKKFDGIILGSSRADMGIDPDHPAWNGHVMYNLAVPAPNMKEMFQLYQFAESVSHLSMVLLAVDFSMFNTYRTNYDSQSTFHLINQLQKSNSRFTQQLLLPVLFSSDAFVSSIKTIVRQDEPYVIYTQKGLGIQVWRKSHVSQYGHRQFFLEVDQDYIRQDWLGQNVRPFALVDAETGRSTVNDFRRMVELCVQNKTDLIVLISPSHARLWAGIWETGLWPTFERLISDMVAILEEHHSERTAGPRLELWNFGGANRVTSEDVPPLGDTVTEMQWHWESSHYKKEVGDMMLDKVFGKHVAGADTIFEGFGERVTVQNIERHLADLRKRMARWMMEHPRDMEEIRAIIRKVQEANRSRSHTVSIPGRA